MKERSAVKVKAQTEALAQKEAQWREAVSELEGQLGGPIRWSKSCFLDSNEDGRRKEDGNDEEDAADGSLEHGDFCTLL